MKTIIVPTDYSACSQHALQYAATLAQKAHAKIILYHSVVIPLTVSEVTVDLPSDEQVIARHIIKLDTIGLEIHTCYHIEVDSYASTMPIEKELSLLVNKYKADLVVMGMHKKNILDTWLLASTTAALIRKATFSLLIVPEKVSFQLPSHILFACDFDFRNNNLTQQFNFLKEFTTTLGTTLKVLHMEQPFDELEDSRLKNAVYLDSLLQGVVHKYGCVQQADVIRGIDQSIKEEKANLLVMMTHKHSFWDRVLNGSTTHKMAKITPIPLLVLPNV